MSRDATVREINAAIAAVAQNVPQDIQPRELLLRRYPGLPAPYADLASHQKLLEALKELTETLARARGELGQSAITLAELEQLAIIQLFPNGLVTSPIWDKINELEARIVALEP